MEILTYYQYFPSLAALLFLFVLTVRFVYLKKSLLIKKPVRFFFPLFALLVIGLTFYLLCKGVLGEYFFRSSLKKNTFSEVYELQRKAIVTNPNIDRYRIRFSQTNLLIANSLLDKSKKTSTEAKQTATKAIQASIEEAKAGVKLNDKKAANWANLGSIYKNLLNMAENADTWSVSAYQRAIVLDPHNGSYRLELGGIYYLLKKYDLAIHEFEEAQRLKPDWPNVYYNLAWTQYQKGETAKAISYMEKTILLLEKVNDSEQIKKAQSDLELFKSLKP